MNFVSKAVLTLSLFALSLVASAQTLTPIDDTYLATGVLSNISSPYSAAPFVSAGTLVTSPTAIFPTFAGMRYELYRDATGKPAYAGTATVKVILRRYAIGKSANKSVFLFVDGEAGGAGSATSISSVFAGEGGVGVQLARHWSVVGEYDVRRIPALVGASKAVLFGAVYNFNRPK